MRFSAAGGGAGAGAEFYGELVAGACYALKAGEHIEQCAHVGGLFLHPDDVAVVAMAGEFGGEFLFWGGIELFEKDDRGGSVFSLLALGAGFVGEFFGADQDSVGI